MAMRQLRHTGGQAAAGFISFFGLGASEDYNKVPEIETLKLQPPLDISIRHPQGGQNLAALTRKVWKHDSLEALPPKERTRRVVSDLFRREGNSVFDETIANAGKGSLLDSRWELAKDSKLGIFNFRAYKPVYLLPAFWSSKPNAMPHSPNPDNTVDAPQALDDVEAKFQISFKTKAVENLFGDNGDIWMAYTQSSRWQVYNGEASRPFRETNYEPEVLLAFRTGYGLLGWKGRMAAVGIDHQSNGRADPLSRSWNRVMFNIGLDREGWALTLRQWIRISDGNSRARSAARQPGGGAEAARLCRRRPVLSAPQVEDRCPAAARRGGGPCRRARRALQVEVRPG
jgi:hypothetical protein